MTIQSDNIGASVWHDNNVVTAMYTSYNPQVISTVMRRNKDSTRVQVQCPVGIAEYNMYMGGVDQGDQNRGYYIRKLKSRKCYVYIANFLLGVAVTNTFIHSPSIQGEVEGLPAQTGRTTSWGVLLQRDRWTLQPLHCPIAPSALPTQCH